MTAIKEQKEQRKKQIVSLAENLEKQYDDINALIEFDKDMYRSMVKELQSNKHEEQKLHFNFNGFLEVIELQEEFKEEYIYLFELSYSYTSDIFSLQTLNSVDAKHELKEYVQGRNICAFITKAIEKVKEQLKN